MQLSAPFRSVRRCIGKIRTIRDEIRTERFMNALPEELRKDIGWPDRQSDRSIQRRRSFD
jgi:hypothetical protein